METHYIDSSAGLANCIDEISSKNSLSVDLEFDKNRFAYGFNLSLIQINTGENIYLIDALSDIDLSPVFEIFEDPDVEIIVFAFGEDIRLLHSCNCFAKNVYDLDFAAKLLDYEPCSLSKLTDIVLGIEEKKSSQKSNWLKRPLTQDQLKYAAEDVRHLSELKRALEVKISNAGISSWLEDENGLYDTFNFSAVQSFSPIKNGDKKGLNQYELFLLEKLMDFREQIAKENNIPGYMIISKELLIDLSTKKKRLKDVMEMKGVSRKLKTGSSKSALHHLLVNSKKESISLGLSEKLPAIPKMSQEEFLKYKASKKRTEKIQRETLDPIKTKLKERIGINAASFIFSNKIMKDISVNGVSGLIPYKRDLITDYAKELNLSLSLIS